MEKYLRTLRQIQSLPRRTATAAVFMLLGALPIEAKIHKKQLSLLHSVITSDKRCLQELLQRQLACSYDSIYSFFYVIVQVLAKYDLPTLNLIFASDIGKLQWKNMCRKAIVDYWTRVHVNDIKTKQTLKYQSVCPLLVGSTHFARLQSSKHMFSNKTLDPTCHLCQLDVEDIRHTVIRCPAFHSIRSSTLTKLRDIIFEYTGCSKRIAYFYLETSNFKLAQK